MIYYLVFTISIAASWLYQRYSGQYGQETLIIETGARKQTDQNKIKAILSLWISALPLFFLSAFRYGIGTDYFYTYTPEFYNIAEGRESYYEPGFWLLNKVISLFTADSQWVFIITSALFIGLLYFVLIKMSRNIPIALLLFFLSYNYYISLNNVRQSLASVILLVGIYFLIRKKAVASFICLACAVLIHRVSVLYILLLIPCIIEIPAYASLAFCAVFAILARWLAGPIMAFVSTFIPRLALYSQAGYLTKYNQESIPRRFIVVNIIIMLLAAYHDFHHSALYGRLFAQASEEKKDKKQFGIMYYRSQRDAALSWQITKALQVLLLCVCCLDGRIPAAYRVVRIFAFPQFLLLSNSIEMHRNKHERRLLYALFVLMMLSLYIKNYMDGVEEVFPYQWVFGR